MLSFLFEKEIYFLFRKSIQHKQQVKSEHTPSPIPACIFLLWGSQVGCIFPFNPSHNFPRSSFLRSVHNLQLVTTEICPIKHVPSIVIPLGLLPHLSQYTSLCPLLVTCNGLCPRTSSLDGSPRGSTFSLKLHFWNEVL